MNNGVRKLLFLCSGNYYRSRFAEILFNLRAQTANLAWRADSRAVSLPENRKYIRGPISPFAIEGLAARGITLDGDVRHPIQIEEADLVNADRIIAMKEAEHREPLERMFPQHARRVEYWQVHDIDCAEPAQCFAEIDEAITALINQMGQAADASKRPSSALTTDN
jgi:protein-tyrosine phosphatase